MTTVPTLPPPPPNLLAGASLFLDFDGTLVELAAEPGLVRVDTYLQDLMDMLQRALGGRVAIVSGRSIAAIATLFDGRLPMVAGSHGVEIQLPDGQEPPERPEKLDAIVQAMHEFARDKPGLFVEQKPFGAALHYRGAPHHGVASHALAGRLAGETGLLLQTGKMMVELRVAGADKGSALRRMMALPPMAGFRPVFIGDDDTDEPAMAAAADLGGVGILVGETRPTRAAYRLADVSATLAWLKDAAREIA